MHKITFPVYFYVLHELNKFYQIFCKAWEDTTNTINQRNTHLINQCNIEYINKLSVLLI